MIHKIKIKQTKLITIHPFRASDYLEDKSVKPKPKPEREREREDVVSSRRAREPADLLRDVGGSAAPRQPPRRSHLFFRRNSLLFTFIFRLIIYIDI